MSDSCNQSGNMVGIITYHRAENYGSALQAYALNRVLNALPAVKRAETVDYEQPSQHQLYSIYGDWTSAMGIARNMHSLRWYRSLKRKKRRFNAFLEKYLLLSSWRGSDSCEVRKTMERTDVMVCGSDQIWNTSCADFDWNYMLSGVCGPKKVAYAPSIGTSVFPENVKQRVRDVLSEFEAIAMRESQGAKAVSELVGHDVETVLDPTLLLTRDEWIRLAADSSFKAPVVPYILCYFIGNVPGMRDFAVRVARESGYKAVVIMKNLRDIGRGFVPVFDAGPLEFVAMIQHAHMVITDSFHAVAFSHLLHTPFFVFTNPADVTKPNTRITNILTLTGHLDRMLDGNNHGQANWSATIDFDGSDKVLGYHRARSLKWLTDNIGADGTTL